MFEIFIPEYIVHAKSKIFLYFVEKIIFYFFSSAYPDTYRYQKF